MSGVRLPSSIRAARRLGQPSTEKALTGPIAERPRARAPATASVPPAVEALTVPIPVITTRGPSVTSALASAEDQADVLAAEAEGVGQRDGHRRGPRLARNAVEGEIGIRGREIGGGWQEAVLKRQHRGDGLHASRGRHGMAD